MAAFRKVDGRIRAVAVDGRATYAQGIQVVLGALVSDVKVVDVALTCEDTLEAILEHSPDIVLIGAHVPNADGLQIAAAVRSHFPAIKILMLSPSPSTREASLAMRIGVNGYLPRGCDADELIRAIKALIAGEIAIATQATDALFSMSAAQMAPVSNERAVIGVRKGGDHDE